VRYMYTRLRKVVTGIVTQQEDTGQCCMAATAETP
jgi:hypothetical protein